MATIVAEFEVCTDCAQISANGTHGHCADCCEDGIVCEERMRTLKGMTRLHGDDAARIVIGDEQGFSHTPCGGCGSILSGDRFAAAILSN